jgi:cytochrome P450
MAELLRHPAVMAKVRDELRDALGSKPHPDESDIDRLPYLRAVVMESMRLHPPSPLLMPHEAMADGAEVGGFAVPAGTKVIINLWAIMRDPGAWPRPEEFVPERFVGTDVDFRSKQDGRLEFMPLGAGRRACPGLPMATRVVTLLLASMLHAFELPEGMQPARRLTWSRRSRPCRCRWRRAREAPSPCLGLRVCSVAVRAGFFLRLLDFYLWLLCQQHSKPITSP